MRRLPLLLLCLLFAAPAFADAPSPRHHGQPYHRVDGLYVEARELAHAARTVRFLAERSVGHSRHGWGRHDRHPRLAEPVALELHPQPRHRAPGERHSLFQP